MSKKWGFQPDGQGVSEKPRFFNFFGSTFFSSPTPFFFLAKKFRFYHVGCFHEQKVGVSAKRPCRQRKTSFFSVSWANIFFLQPHPVFFSPKSFVFIHVGCFHEQKVGVSAKRPCRQRKTSFFSVFWANIFFLQPHPVFFSPKSFAFITWGVFMSKIVGVSAKRPCRQRKTSFFQFFGPTFFFFSHTLFFSRQKVSFLSRGLFS